MSKSMPIDTVKPTEQPKLHIWEIIPYECTKYDIKLEESQLIDLVRQLRSSWTDSVKAITDPNQSIEHHCLSAIICSAMVRLVRTEKYDAFDAISAIALEHAGAIHERVIDAWERANRSGSLRQGVASRIAMEAQLQIKREPFDTDFDYGVLLAPCASLPLRGIRDSLELAMRHTYQMAHNFLCHGGFDPAVVLAVHAVEQLERLGYETGLVLCAIAVEDTWDLLNVGDITAEDAWQSALKDNGRMAAVRVQNARTESFVAAMSELQMEDETIGSNGSKKASHAWVGVLSDSDTVDPAQVIKSDWMGDAVDRADFANVERGIGNMAVDQDDMEQGQDDTDEEQDDTGENHTQQWLWADEEVMVTDEEVREFEQMLED